MAEPIASQVRWGPGKLYVAPIGTAEPTNLGAPWINWYRLGYTTAGTTINYALTTAQIQVAETPDPIATLVTDRNISVVFTMAEFSLRNWQLALSGGLADNTVVNASAWSYEPPVIGQEQRVMLGWDDDTSDRRFIFRKCFQSGSVALNAQKGASAFDIPVTFTVEVPDQIAGVTPAPLKVFGSAALNASAPKITS